MISLGFFLFDVRQERIQIMDGYPRYCGYANGITKAKERLIERDVAQLEVISTHEACTFPGGQ